MNTSIILAHPTPGSFNHAIAAAARDALQALDHQVVLHDLYAEGFDPVLPTAEIARDALLPPAIAQHVAEIVAADAIVIVHPNYWSRPPAILCGWVDRVLRPGRAYTFVPDGQGGARPMGLLKARVGLVFTTANTPQAKEEALFGDPLETHWRTVVFGLCGVTNVQRRTFSPVITSSAEQRHAWLRDVQSTIETHFAAETE